MKLGPNLRRKYTKLHEFVRKVSVPLEYSIWVAIDPSKYTLIRNKSVKKIIVVLINHKGANVGGDFVILGVMNYFKKLYPHVEVSFLGDEATLKRFGEVPGIDMIPYSGPETIQDLKFNLKPDAALFINLGPTKPKDYLFIPYRIATFYPSIRSILVPKNKIFYTRKPYVPWGTHMTEFGFKMLESLGFKFEKKDTLFYYSKEDDKKANSFLKQNNIKKFVIMHPGGKHVVDTLKSGKWPPHLWPLERYAEVADHLSNQGYKVIITGTKDESYLFKKINKLSKSKIVDSCGKLSIREVAALLQKASLLICTDTSIAHVAYQVKVPIVELIGPSCAEVVAAWPLNSPRHKILIDNGPCARNMKKIYCPEDIVCLENISVNQVIEASSDLLTKFKTRKNIPSYPTFVFRADGGSPEKDRPRNEQGTGHITRSILLAKHLKSRGFDSIFVMKNLPGKNLVEKEGFKIETIREKNEPKQLKKILSKIENPWLIIDKLALSESYVKSLKPLVEKLITVDNPGRGSKHADLNIYPLYNKPLISSSNAAFHSGPELVIFSDKLYAQSKIKKVFNKKVKTLLVTLGGTDPTQTTLKVINALSSLTNLSIKIVIGPSFDFKDKIFELTKNLPHLELIENTNDLSKLIFDADLAILSGGITPYEAAILGTPSIVLCHNQGELDHSFKDYGFNINLGLASKIPPEKIKSEVIKLLENPAKRKKMMDEGKALFKANAKDLITDLIFNQRGKNDKSYRK